MDRQLISHLKNFSIDELSVFKETIFGKMEDLNDNFIFDFDKMLTKTKEKYGAQKGICVIHDFNMRGHTGKDHPLGLAADWHFKGISLFQTVMICIEHGYRKIFFYPYWNIPGVHTSYYPDREGVLLGYGYYEKRENPENGKVEFIQKIVTNTWEPMKVYRKLQGLK